MKFDIAFERVYPHRIEKVWRALTDTSLLGQWLMETDFAPEVGRSFTMWCKDDQDGTDEYLCEVLECDPPFRMRWSWVVDGHQSLGNTYVEFQLEETEDGARLTIRHSGDRDPKIFEAFKSGWPHKLDRLEDLLG